MRIKNKRLSNPNHFTTPNPNTSNNGTKTSRSNKKSKKTTNKKHQKNFRKDTPESPKRWGSQQAPTAIENIPSRIRHFIKEALQPQSTGTTKRIITLLILIPIFIIRVCNIFSAINKSNLNLPKPPNPTQVKDKSLKNKK